MSLKAFHIFFIGLSALASFGFGAWLIDGYSSPTASVEYLFWGVLSLIAGGGLVLYGIRFLKTMKHVSFL